MTDLRVLFVDDEVDLRLAGEQTLSLADIPVVACASGAEALDHLSADFPGILVTDIRMPGMGGTDLMEAALQLDPDLPVILVTGHGDVERRGAGERAHHGARDLIAAPVQIVDRVQVGGAAAGRCAIAH